MYSIIRHNSDLEYRYGQISTLCLHLLLLSYLYFYSSFYFQFLFTFLSSSLSASTLLILPSCHCFHTLHFYLHLVFSSKQERLLLPLSTHLFFIISSSSLFLFIFCSFPLHLYIIYSLANLTRSVSSSPSLYNGSSLSLLHLIFFFSPHHLRLIFSSSACHLLIKFKLCLYNPLFFASSSSSSSSLSVLIFFVCIFSSFSYHLFLLSSFFC